MAKIYERIIKKQIFMTLTTTACQHSDISTSKQYHGKYIFFVFREKFLYSISYFQKWPQFRTCTCCI